MLFAINTASQVRCRRALCNVLTSRPCSSRVHRRPRSLRRYNSFIIRKTEARVAELGRWASSASSWHRQEGWRVLAPPPVRCRQALRHGQSPTTDEAQAIADEVYSEFVGEEVDKVELVYSRFVSSFRRASIQTLLHVQGGRSATSTACLDAKEDIMFTLTWMAVRRKGTLETEVAGRVSYVPRTPTRSSTRSSPLHELPDPPRPPEASPPSSPRA